MEYSLMTPPFKMKNFEDMTDKEAREHYDWYLENVQIVKKSEEAYQNELLKSNPMTRDFIKSEEIPKGWLSVAMDISIYFSECIVKNQKQLNWD